MVTSFLTVALLSGLALAADDAVARVNADGFSGVQVVVPPKLDQNYYIGPGDTLHIKVLGEAEMTGSFDIGPDGSIRYPLLGQVYVAGMSPQQVGGLVARLLNKDYLVEPEVFVTVKDFGSQPVEVTGLVDKPAVYHLEGPTTLRELLAMAGGVADETITQIEVTRGEERLTVRYEDLVRPGGDIAVVSGDQVHVPQGNAVYVLGQVGEPGAVAWQDGITLTKALTKAGGLQETAKITKVYILRDGERIEVRYKRVLKGKEADFVLEPEDQVFIDVSHI